MPSDFDPYREWLGIPATERPLTHYQLLDLKPGESDRERIENAEMIQMAKVLRHEGGPHAELAARINGELEQAIRCLLDPASKAAYDELEQPAKPAAAGHDFSADLTLDEDEAIEEELTVAATQPAKSASATAFSHPPAARSVAPRVEEEVEEEVSLKRPSLLEMLEKPKETKKAGKEKPAREKQVKAQSAAKPSTKPVEESTTSYDELIPVKPASAEGQRNPNVARVLLGVVTVVLLLVWLGPILLRSRPDADPVMKKLADASPRTRIEGIDGLRYLEMNPSEVAALLIKLLKEDQADEVRIAAVNALVNHGIGAESLAELKPLVEQERHPSVKAMLNWLLDQGKQ